MIRFETVLGFLSYTRIKYVNIFTILAQARGPGIPFSRAGFPSSLGIKKRTAQDIQIILNIHIVHSGIKTAASQLECFGLPEIRIMFN